MWETDDVGVFWEGIHGAGDAACKLGDAVEIDLSGFDTVVA